MLFPTNTSNDDNDDNDCSNREQVNEREQSQQEQIPRRLDCTSRLRQQQQQQEQQEVLFHQEREAFRFHPPLPSSLFQPSTTESFSVDVNSSTADNDDSSNDESNSALAASIISDNCSLIKRATLFERTTDVTHNFQQQLDLEKTTTAAQALSQTVISSPNDYYMNNDNTNIDSDGITLALISEALNILECDDISLDISLDDEVMWDLQ